MWKKRLHLLCKCAQLIKNGDIFSQHTVFEEVNNNFIFLLLN